MKFGVKSPRKKLEKVLMKIYKKIWKMFKENLQRKNFNFFF